VKISFAKIVRIYDYIITIAAVLAGILVIFLMVSVGLEVALRYFVGHPTSWVVEIAGYCLLYIPFLVAAWVLKKEGHVRMDLLVDKLGLRTQSLLNAITSIVGAVICLFLTVFGAKATVYFIGYQTPTILMLPKSAIISIISVGSFLLFIQFLRRTHAYLKRWRGIPEKEAEPLESHELRL
jgi:C4-dicarboxylate transporter DctQ subunit